MDVAADGRYCKCYVLAKPRLSTKSHIIRSGDRAGHGQSSRLLNIGIPGLGTMAYVELIFELLGKVFLPGLVFTFTHHYLCKYGMAKASHISKSKLALVEYNIVYLKSITFILGGFAQ